MAVPGAVADVQELRAQIARVQGVRATPRTLPTPAPLRPLLPDRGLRPGASYAVESSAGLLLAMLAEASRAGSWCAAVGLPELGIEAAAHAGVELDRLALVPRPGARWLSVVAALVDAFPLVVLSPTATPSPSEIARLSARLQERESTLLVKGPWPGVEASFAVSDPVWEHIGVGHGYLRSRELTVTVRARRLPRPRSARLLLPGLDAAVALAPPVRQPADLLGQHRVPAMPGIRRAQDPGARSSALRRAAG